MVWLDVANWAYFSRRIFVYPETLRRNEVRASVRAKECTEGAVEDKHASFYKREN